MRIERNPAGGGFLILRQSALSRRLTAIFLLFVGGVATAGAVHNFTPRHGGYIVYGVICSMIAVSALPGGTYMLLLRTGQTVDVAGRTLTAWKRLPFWSREVRYDLRRCTAIEVRTYWYFNRTRQTSDSFYCAIRLWTAEDGTDVVITRKVRDTEGKVIAESLSNVLDLPIEWTRGGARGVVVDE